MRVPPALPVTAVKTYAIASQMRPATCQEVDCEYYLNGWVTVVDADKAELVRSLRGRYSFTERPLEGGLFEFTFPPGQQCFEATLHRLPWEGRERFAERDGDWRGDPTGSLRIHRPDDWVDSFANHQIRLADRLGKG